MNTIITSSRKAVVVLLGSLFLFFLPTYSEAQVTQIQRWDGASGLGFFVKKLSDNGGNPNNRRMDGIPDIIISKTCGELGFCQPNAGAVYVYSGKDRSLIFQISGTAWSYTVDAGDLNGDGVPDLFIGEMGQTPDRARAFSGLNGSPIPGLVFYSDGVDDGFGVCVSSIGDITGDGVTELIVGALDNYVVIYSGADGSRVKRIDGPVGQSSDHFGISVSEAGDVNGDGTPDFIVGDNNASPPGGPANAGSAFVFSGRIDLNFPVIYRFNGENSGDRFGGCCSIKNIDTSCIHSSTRIRSPSCHTEI